MIADRVKLDVVFDVFALQRELASLQSELWINHFVQQNYEGEWCVIALRGPAGAEHPIQMIYSDPSCSEFADTPYLAKCPYIRDVLSWFKCPLQSVRLMKLTAGSHIKEHCDHDLEVESGAARLHIPLLTSTHVDFRLNGSSVVMREGECWYLRLSEPHSVKNDGSSDRVHLVIDTLVNDWLLEELTRPSQSPT